MRRVGRVEIIKPIYTSLAYIEASDEAFIEIPNRNTKMSASWLSRHEKHSRAPSEVNPFAIEGWREGKLVKMLTADQTTVFLLLLLFVCLF